jgi:hypothetical protein
LQLDLRLLDHEPLAQGGRRLDLGGRGTDQIPCAALLGKRGGELGIRGHALLERRAVGLGQRAVRQGGQKILLVVIGSLHAFSGIVNAPHSF